MTLNDLPLQWKWNEGFTDSVGTWTGGGDVWKMWQGDYSGGPTAITPTDGYKQPGSLTLTGTQLAHMSSGWYEFHALFLLINNNTVTNGTSFTIKVSSTGSDGNTVRTTKTGLFRDLYGTGIWRQVNSEPVQITSGVDSDREYAYDHVHLPSCYREAGDVAYSISVDFPNYDTNTVSISFQVDGLQDVHYNSADFPDPPGAKWGIDDAEISELACNCGGANGSMQYTPGAGAQSQGGGKSIGTAPTWGTGFPFASGSANGNNTTIGGSSHLLSEGSNTIVVDDEAGGLRWFDDITGTGKYLARGGNAITLAHSDSDHTFTFTDSDGIQSIYADFSTNVTSALQGTIEYGINPKGSSAATLTTYAYDGNNRLSTITRQTVDASNTVTGSEQFSYAYISSGVNAGKIDSITLQRATNGGGYVPWRETKFRYYDGSSAAPTNPASVAYGNSGDLMSAQLLDATTTNLTAIETSYMRYFTPSGSGTNGYTGGLEYVVGSQSYARMVAAGSDPLAAAVSDSTVATYADDAYQYDSFHQVTQHVVQGAGTTGQGTYTYTHGFNNGTNTVTAGDGHGASWVSRIDETLPDGTTNRTYYDAGAEPLLSITIDPAAHNWGTYYLRDTDEHVLATFNPSTMSLPSQSTLEANPDLLNFQYGRSSYLNLASGKVDYTDYYDKTDSGLESTPGGVYGFPQDQGVGRGELSIPVSVSSISHTSTTVLVTTSANHGYRSGDTVLISGSAWSDYNGTHVISSVGSTTFQFTATDPGTNSIGTGITAVELPTITEAWTYWGHSNSAAAFIYPVATDTRYRNTDGSGDEVTRYSYGWYSDSLQMQYQMVTRPPITGDQNGPASDTGDTGDADTTTTYYDIYGRPVWAKDGDGFITYTEYDPNTGAVTKSIVDVNTTNTADFSGKPSDWTSTNHSALHLITTYTVDRDGRVTEVTDPTGQNLTVNVYNDAGHEVRTYRGYMSGTNFAEVGPTVVHREDRAGSYTEDLTLAAAPHLTGGMPDGTESITTSGIRTLSRTHTTSGGQVDESDRYFTFASGTNTVSYSQGAGTFQLGGTAGANVYYYATQYGYDSAGRQNRVVNPLGTITRTVFDALGRTTSQWVGTSDTVSGTWSPTNAGGMTKLSENFYDTYDPTAVGIGDGNLTRTVSYPFGTTTSTLRVTENFYDWRDRLVASKVGLLLDSNNRFANSSGETGQSGTNVVHRPITYYTYDNLDEVTQTDSYDGDGVSLSGTNGTVVDSDADGVPDAPSDATKLVARSKTLYDDQGRVYRTSVFSVDPTNGTYISSTSLDTNTWYDHRGNVMAQGQLGGSTLTKLVYDGAGRLVKQYTTDGGWLNNGSSAAGVWSNAASVANDIVLQQVETTYDAAGNPILTTTRQRYHNDATNSTGGGLGDLRDPSNNPKARVSFVANYYDHANRLTDTMDVGTVGSTNGTFSRPSSPWSPSGTALVTTTAYNDSGWTDTVTDPRATISKTYYDLLGRQTRTVAAFVDPGTNALHTATDHNQITDYTYDGSDHVVTQTAWVNNNGTNNVFQTTKYVYGVTTSTSGINDNDLLLQIQYPDKTTGSANTNSAYTETYAYDAVGEETKKTQRTGSVHQLSYDTLGRMTSDNVITLGGAVNGSIRRIDYSFDNGGRLYRATSYSNTNGSTIRNEVQRDYNGLGQVTREWQSQTGGVVTAAGTSQTTSVQYTYSALSGGANHSRLTSIIYPEGDRTVTYDYSRNSGLDDVISRLSALTQTIGTNSATTLESYDYLGAGTIVAKHHPENGIDLTYEQQAGDTNAPATNDGGDIYTGLDRFGRVIDQNWLNTNSGTSLTSTDRFQYGYDADSNVMYKKNIVSSSNSELYHTNGTNGTYDSLNRLTAFRRGTLSDANSDGIPDTITTASANRSWTLDAQGNWSANPSGDTYAVNQENQYTSLTHSSCGGNTSLNFAYDNDGNMTSRVDSSGFGQSGYVADSFAFDAWDRLATMTHTIANSGGVQWTESDFDIDGLGRRDQIVVTQNNCTAVPSDNLFYSIDWQVLEDDRATSVNNGVATGWTRNQYVWSPTYVNDLVLRDKDTNHDNGFAERLYVQQDANHNVTTITNTSGTVQERFVYDPYGAATVLNSNWSTTSDSKTWIYLFQGGHWDSYAGLYNFQRREYDPTLGRWMQQDPAGYIDGASLYEFVRGAPLTKTDPFGLSESNDLVLKLLDLEARQRYDRSQHGGNLSPVGEWLEKEMFKVRFKLTQTDTVFAIYRRDVHVDGASGAAGNACGGHWLVTTVDRPWHDGQVIGYALTDTHSPAGVKVSKEIYHSKEKDEYSLIATTTRIGLQVEGLGKDSMHATDDEIAGVIAKHLTSKPYGTATYNCHDWAEEAIQAAGLSETTANGGGMGGWLVD